MRRQVVIGGLVGIALGGLITFSFAHGIVSWQSPTQNAAPASGIDDDGLRDDVDAGFAPHRPLRPGSDRVGKAREKANALAATTVGPDAPSV